MHVATRPRIAGAIALALGIGAAVLPPAAGEVANAATSLGTSGGARASDAGYFQIPRGTTGWAPVLVNFDSALTSDFSLTMTLTDGYVFDSIMDNDRFWAWTGSGSGFDQSNWQVLQRNVVPNCRLSQAKTQITCDVHFANGASLWPIQAGVMTRISTPMTAPATPKEFRGTATGSQAKTINTGMVDTKPRTPITQDDTASTRQNRPVDVDVLANDTANDVPGTVLDPASLKLVSGGALVDSIDVTGGEVTVVDGKLRFTPNASFTGRMGQATYSIADTDGYRSTARATVDVAAISPVARDDSAIVWQGSTTGLQVLTNDEAGDASVPLDPDSVRLAGGTDGGKRLFVAGEGTYTAGSDGVVSFAAEKSFSGAATPVTYSVADANGTTATAAIRVTVSAVVPTAADDTASTIQGQPVTVHVLDNDAAGEASVPLDPSTLTITAGVDQPGVGRFTISNGDLVFTPESAFSGDATATYTIADANGTTATANVTVSVGRVVPALGDDTATTLQGQPVTIDVLDNDAAGNDTAPLDEDSLTLTGTDSHFAVVDGEVRYTPAKSFTGDATTTYTVTDANGTVGTATVTVTVDPVVPTAVNDTAEILQGQPVTIDVLANDTAGNAAVPLVPGTLTLADADPGFTVRDGKIRYTPAADFSGAATATYTIADANGTIATADVTVTVAAVLPALGDDTATTLQGQPVTIDVLDNDRAGDPTAPLDDDSLTLTGTDSHFAIVDGTVRYTPAKSFTGTATTTYTVTDANGTIGTATISVTVDPVTPTAENDTAETLQGQAVTVDVLANDTAGDDSAPLDEDTLAISAGGDQAGIGTFVAADGVVTFAPEATFTGEASATYAIEDANGTTATATLTVTVDPVLPALGDDTATTLQGQPVTIDVLDNDRAGDPTAPLHRDSLTLTGTDDHFTIVDGTVRYTPTKEFTGEASTTYTVTDANGTVGTATVTVGVTPVVPSAVDDAVASEQGDEVIADVLANDHAGDPVVPLDPSTLQLETDEGLVDQVEQPGVGVLHVVDGAVVFQPETAFTGTTEIVYQVADANGTTTTAELRLTVAAVVPVAEADEASTMQGRAVSIDLLANDHGGREQTPLVRSSLTLVAPDADATDDPADRASDDDATGDGSQERVDRVEMPGEGVWTLDGTTATFAPEPSFTGDAVVAYAVSDVNGTTVSATATVTVEDAGFRARADVLDGVEGERIVGDVLANDETGRGGAIDPSTLRLLDGDDRVRELVVDGQGTWQVVDGQVAFTPDAHFVGTSDPVTYAVDNADGVSASATVEAEMAEAPVVPAPTPLELAFTGMTGLTAGLLALGAMALGGVLLLLRRRRAE